jgi:AcrR family transcriptional regulator
MRVTAEIKKETRDRILDSARKLFSENGFEKTTTRDIAAAAGIASGTLFNYFRSKEALAMTIVAGALDEAKQDFLERRRGDESLEEVLFLHVMTGLRRLEPHRHYVGAVIETAMSPFTEASVLDEGGRVRADHIETVGELIVSRGVTDEPSFLVMHLYWTLYVGVLAFWSNDTSPNQEDTLALLDQSLRLFVGSLASNVSREEAGHGA